MRFKSRSRALAASALAASLGLAGLAFTAAPAQAAEETDVVRVAGTTRYGTAADAATSAYPSGSADVVLASGEKFPDALAGGGLAGSLDGPILLTQQDAVPADTAAALEELGAENITILGGTAAVSASVETALEALGYTVDRVAGADRFETAGLIAEELGGTTAVLANGLNFPDALAISPGAHALGLPVLLTTADGLQEDAAAYIDGNAVDSVIIVGGTAAVSQATEDALEADGIDVTRLAGATRYESAIEIAEFHTTQGFTLAEVAMATGEDFADALAGGPYASQMGAPMVLTQTATLTPSTAAFLSDNCQEIDALSILGGTAAIATSVENAAAAAAQCATPAGVTIRPELVSAEILQTVTPGTATPTQPAGTYVRFSFDEPVSLGVTNPNRFAVYNANSTQADTGDAATLEPGGTSVVVLFNALTNSTQAATLTVATVVEDAVRDSSGNANPEGDAAIGTGASSGLTAGVTAAPDLQSVSGFRQGAAVGQTAVDFVFDEPATVQGAGGFFLVLQDNSTIACTSSTTPAASAPSGGSVPGGSGTATITVVCANPDITGPNPGGTPLSAANVARGAVDAGAVEDTSTSTVPNPLQAADVGNSGNTSGPDLVSATLIQGTTDQALLTFDTPVTLTDPTLVNAYTSAGAETPGVTGAVSATNPAQVLINFTDGSSLDSAVGISVEPAAVAAAAAPNPANARDEVATANSNETTIVPGRTAAPDLTGVAVTATNGFIPATATYTFDQNVEPGANIVDANFFLYSSTGVKITATDCARGTTYNGTGAAASGTDSAAASPSVTCAFGLTGNAGTNGAVINAVLGTVAAGAVDDDANNALTNPEGAAFTTGGTGTPAS